MEVIVGQLLITKPSLRLRLYQALDPAARVLPGLSAINKVIAGLIMASVAVTVLESEPYISDGNEGVFTALEAIFLVAFTLEYIVRFWVCIENPIYGRGIFGRLRYMGSPAALLDLLALMPLLLGFVGTDAFLLRLVRLIRIFRLAKLGRYSVAMATIAEAVRSRRYELIMSTWVAGGLLLVSSTLLHVVEGTTQPEAFGSIPRAMWWSIATLTTVGYGDVFPVTMLGRLLAGATAITGIGLIAMPTGILAAAFSDAMQKRREEDGRS